jgi:hypothetical protein
LGPARLKFPTDTPRAKQSLGTDLVFNYLAANKQQGLPDGFELDPTAPVRAIRNNDEDELSEAMSPLQAVAEEDDKPRGQVDDPADVNVAPNDETERKEWGESFKIEWLCTDRLPFYRTRHLRNPWNHDREIKVSRDGTELEPNVGQQLLDDWASIAAESTADVDRGSTSAGRRGQGVPASTTMPPLFVPPESGTPGGKAETRRSWYTHYGSNKNAKIVGTYHSLTYALVRIIHRLIKSTTTDYLVIHETRTVLSLFIGNYRAFMS